MNTLDERFLPRRTFFSVDVPSHEDRTDPGSGLCHVEQCSRVVPCTTGAPLRLPALAFRNSQTIIAAIIVHLPAGRWAIESSAAMLCVKMIRPYRARVIARSPTIETTGG